VNPAVIDLLECPNCGTPLVRRYCAQCGQKVGPINPTVHDFVHDLTHEFLHVDGKIFRTVRLLATRPGLLTREYFEGRKARSVSPLRLYLIFSVMYFAAATLVLSKEPIFRPDEAVEVGTLGGLFGVERATPEQANSAVLDVQTHWGPRVMFVLVPVSAWLVQLVTRRSGRNYPQHLYFALHVHAWFFGLLTVTTLTDLLNVRWLSNTLSVAQPLLLIAYMLVAFHIAYGGRWWLAARRTAFVFVAYIAVILAATIAIATALAGRALSR
jgi:hypothetical protein